PLLTQVGRDVTEFLNGSAAALVLRRHAPSLEPAEVSLKAYDAEVNALRTEGLTRRLSIDEVERLFALGFMLEQIHRNLGDLAKSTTWSVELYNCNAFVADIAKFMGLRVPSSSWIFPKVFVSNMRKINTGHPEAANELVSENVKEMSNPTRDGRAMIAAG